MYTISAAVSKTAADYVYISESNKNWEKIFDTKMIG